ncbi:hypothetical protein BGZ95_008436 [Linnemannia exigua]|uniref:C2H2-type domain-containing protein n=1 Tax=Linnemannia exigua TaxID=604196 RepID=A0AAD4DFT8_9FUNG|nr:hypothetical protein BGZ95_008436 [Linnemannia exigua]
MPATIPSPAINITAAPATPIPVVLASSPSFNSLRRPSLALSVGSFHAAQLRRPSFFSPLPYSHSPQYSDLSHGTLNDAYGSSPRIGGGDVYERDLEANYCKNFSCCGLTLGDLHALLQHYEEAHVRFEEDDFEDDFEDLLGFTDDDGWSTHSESTPGSPQMDSASRQYSSSTAAAKAAAAATVAALTSTLSQKPVNSNVVANKKSNGVSLSDIYSEDSMFMIPDEAVSAFPNSVFRSSSSLLLATHNSHNTQAQAMTATPAIATPVASASKKRDLAAFSSSFDTQSPISKKATTSPSKTASITDAKSASSTEGTSTTSTSQEDLMSTVTSYLEHAIQNGLLPNCGEVGSPSYILAAEELLQKREEIVSMMESIGRSGTSGADKPYRCSVDGCDKAYKNPNGLKYHHQHGHCSVPGSSEDDKSNVKPYRCTFLDCGKCYKNLNGLKYHIEHSHPNLATALQAHVTGAPAMDGAQASQTAIAAAAAIAAVKGDSVMMSAIHAIISSNANGQQRLSNAAALAETTPDSSPNSSPVLAPIDTTPAKATVLKNPYSTNVTPLTSPVLSRAALSIQTTLSAIQQQQLATGLATPASLSPTSPRSPVSFPIASPPQVSTLTAALAAVAAEQQRILLEQQQ